MSALAVTNGHVLTGVSGQGAVAGTLLVENGVIQGIYDDLSGAKAAAGGAAEVVDIAGLTVMAGMMDTHVHLFIEGSVSSAEDREFPVSTAEKCAAMHVRAGVTTVRDVGAPMPDILGLRDRIAAKEIVGPRIVAAGGIMTSPKGHGHFIGTEVRDGAELSAAIRDAAGKGVDCIKIAVSGGVSTPDCDLFAVQFGEEDVRAGVDTAHELGLHVAAHASNSEAIRISAATGVDSVEHAVMIDDAALDALVTSTAVLSPTLTATDHPLDLLDDPRVPEFVREKGQITIPRHRPSIRRAIQAGVTMVGGTDAGSTATGHGRIATEADQLVKCGLSTEQAVAAVTHNSAALFGLGDQLGTLEPGKVADAIVIGGNPLDDISHLDDIRLVVKEGEIIHRSQKGDSSFIGAVSDSKARRSLSPRVHIGRTSC